MLDASITYGHAMLPPEALSSAFRVSDAARGGISEGPTSTDPGPEQVRRRARTEFIVARESGAGAGEGYAGACLRSGGEGGGG